VKLVNFKGNPDADPDEDIQQIGAVLRHMTLYTTAPEHLEWVGKVSASGPNDGFLSAAQLQERLQWQVDRTYVPPSRFEWVVDVLGVASFGVMVLLVWFWRHPSSIPPQLLSFLMSNWWRLGMGR